jgi:hypothetical protein
MDQRPFCSVIVVVVALALVVVSSGLPTAEEVTALCEIGALSQCAEDCRLGCDVCGATCSPDKAHITTLSLKGLGMTQLPETFGYLRWVTTL